MGAPSRGGALLQVQRFLGSRGGHLAFYVFKRVLWLVPVLFFVILVTFVLAHAAPGGPWDRNGGRELSDAVRKAKDIKYGLDKPFWEQFVIYVGNVIHFDFGTSLQSEGIDVKDRIFTGWKYTAQIGLLAFLFIVPVGIGTGVIAALRQNTWVDYVVLALSTAGAAVPNFVVGFFLVILLAIIPYKFTGGNFALPVSGPPADDAWFGIDIHYLMPVLTLAFLPIAYIGRLTRSSTLETLRQDYVRTAWAKGLPERKVVIGHVLKNSLIPVVTALGPLFAILVTGSVVVESVFQIPGVGKMFIDSIGARDYPVILGLVIQFALIVAIANLIVDILYVVIDPRIRLE
ncbi:MAG: oligopeptide transport system permease protein [Chloroflexota bacterium]|jgi:ABC-type dipeptide/oligopeptide/nickel transport system permease component|nr:oligopeptide transport system permease protein [Chloroflexota bacterium]